MRNGTRTVVVSVILTGALMALSHLFHLRLDPIPSGRVHAAIPAEPPTLVVNTTDDTDDGTCDAAHCSLRDALAAAGGRPGPDTITFSIPTTDPGYDPATGVWTIQPATTYHVPPDTIVDGSIEVSLASGGTSPRPGIEIDGTTLGPLGITSLWVLDNVTLRGLVINRFAYGIWIAAANVTIEGCYLGTDPTGTSARPNVLDAILVASGATGAVIQDNVLSGNSGNGVRLFGETTTGHTIRNNHIGTDVTATAALPNGKNGIRLHAGAHDNTIGPDNLIPFNIWDGVSVEDTGTRGNTISHNRIHSNGRRGILLYDGGNEELASPVITATTPTQVSGTACHNCVVEVFSDDEDQGEIYEGTTTADATGRWTFVKPGELAGPHVTATATDGAGNTSEFSEPATVYRVNIYLPTVLKTGNHLPG